MSLIWKGDFAGLPGKVVLANPMVCANTAKGDNKLYSDAKGVVPSLDLRFASQKNLNDYMTGTPLVDHQRSMSGSNLSPGTFVNSSGLIETAKVNLASNSNYGTGWSKSFFAQTPVLDTTGPDNITNSAFTLVANNSGGNNYVEAITPTVTVKTSTSYTVSFFAKADTLNYVMIRTNGFTTPADFKRAYFDLLTGVTGERNAGDSSDIVSYGGGWYRCIYTFTTDPTDTTGNFYIGLASGTTDATASYLAPLDGVSSVVLFGLQVEEGTTASPYIPTTGVASAAPRFDHDPTTGESLGLLVEESRTNTLLNSATLSTQSVTTSATAYTLSFYGTGTVTLSGTSTAGPLVGTGANDRVTLTFTPTAGTLTLTVTGTVSNAQLEAGSFPTSYIPTTGTALTRSADVASITGSNFSSWYNSTEGTLYYNNTTSGVPVVGVEAITYISDGTGNNYIGSFIPNEANHRTVVRDGGTNQFLANAIPTADVRNPAKVALAYQANNFISAGNGNLNLLDTSGTVPTVDRLHFGEAGGAGTNLATHWKRLTYFPERLPDANLQTMTTP